MLHTFFLGLAQNRPPNDEWIFRWLVLERDWIRREPTVAPLVAECVQEWSKSSAHFRATLVRYGLANERVVHPADEECPVCLYPLSDDPILTRCGHFFDRHCLAAWLDERKTCPVCRRILLE